MQLIHKLIHTVLITMVCAPLLIGITVFVASFFIPAGTYLPEELPAIRAKMKLSADAKPMISSFQGGVGQSNPLVFRWGQFGARSVSTVRT